MDGDKLSDETHLGIIPCVGHNCWDNVRVKNNIVTLVCRKCGKRFKALHPVEPKCHDFYHSTCPLGSSCPLLHIFRTKKHDVSYADSFDQQLNHAAHAILNKHNSASPKDHMAEIRAMHSESGAAALCDSGAEYFDAGLTLSIEHPAALLTAPNNQVFPKPMVSPIRPPENQELRDRERPPLPPSQRVLLSPDTLRSPGSYDSPVVSVYRPRRVSVSIDIATLTMVDYRVQSQTHAYPSPTS